MKKKDNAIPFANDVQKAKNDFKQMIDKMEEEEFLEFLGFVDYSFHEYLDEDFDEDFDDDEDCDCDWCKGHEDCEDYESPFSGEMINFKCTKCGKFTPEPIEIINDIYEETGKPLTDCRYCEEKVSPVYYKAPDGKIFED